MAEFRVGYLEEITAIKFILHEWSNLLLFDWVPWWLRAFLIRRPILCKHNEVQGASNRVTRKWHYHVIHNLWRVDNHLPICTPLSLSLSGHNKPEVQIKLIQLAYYSVFVFIHVVIGLWRLEVLKKPVWVQQERAVTSCPERQDVKHPPRSKNASNVHWAPHNVNVYCFYNIFHFVIMDVRHLLTHKKSYSSYLKPPDALRL